MNKIHKYFQNKKHNWTVNIQKLMYSSLGIKRIQKKPTICNIFNHLHFGVWRHELTYYLKSDMSETPPFIPPIPN